MFFSRKYKPYKCDVMIDRKSFAFPCLLACLIVCFISYYFMFIFLQRRQSALIPDPR